MRHFPIVGPQGEIVLVRYSPDQPRDPNGEFAHGSSEDAHTAAYEKALADRDAHAKYSTEYFDASRKASDEVAKAAVPVVNEIVKSYPSDSGKEFYVIRAQSSRSDTLDGKNAADLMGVAQFLDSDAQEFTQGGDHLALYKITNDDAGQFGKYDALRGGATATKDGIGRSVNDMNWHTDKQTSTWYSFGAKGYKAELVTLVKMDADKLQAPGAAKILAIHEALFGNKLADGKTMYAAPALRYKSDRDGALAHVRSFNTDQPRDKDGKFTMGNVATFKNEADGISAHVTSYNGRLHVTLFDDDSGNVVSSSIFSGEGMKDKAIEKAQKLAGVSKRFSEDQPRDPDGKFASGGGDLGKKEPLEMLNATMSTHEARSAIIRNRARELNFPVERVKTEEGQGKEFQVGEHTFREAGHAEIYTTGNIVCYTGSNVRDSNLGGLVAHEVEHIRFQGVLNDYNNDMKVINGWASTNHEQYDAVTTPQGYVDPDKAFSFPAAGQLNQYLEEHIDQLEKEDGVSEYSKTYWAVLHTDATNGMFKEWRERAVHETLAEIARMKFAPEAAEKGDTKPTKMWTQLFQAVNRIAKKQGYGY